MRGYTLFDNGAVRLFILDAEMPDFLKAVLAKDMSKLLNLRF